MFVESIVEFRILSWNASAGMPFLDFWTMPKVLPVGFGKSLEAEAEEKKKEEKCRKKDGGTGRGEGGSGKLPPSLVLLQNTL